MAFHSSRWVTKNRLRLLVLLFLLCSSLLPAIIGSPKQQSTQTKTATVQDTSQSTSGAADSTSRAMQKESIPRVNIDWIKAVGVVVALFGFVLAFYRYKGRSQIAFETQMAKVKADYEGTIEHLENEIEILKRSKTAELEAQQEFEAKQKEQEIQTAEDAYKSNLREQLDTIKMVGVPKLEDVAVKLPEVFVHLRISEEHRGEKVPRIDDEGRLRGIEKDYTPSEILNRVLAIYKCRLLLIIGDPGSGKSTLLKHFALTLLAGDFEALNLPEPYFPLFFSLRKLNLQKPLPDNLADDISTHKKLLYSDVFENWLDNRPTLVLLDGLDEISEIGHRKKACDWIFKQHAAYKKACFVVTSRSTGYRKSDGVELQMEYLRADIRDFTPDQQEEFLGKWFKAAYSSESISNAGKTLEWRTQQTQKAELKVNGIINYLKKPENLSLRQLAGIPMILQIMAIIWKEKDFLPRTRLQLFEVAMDYLLEYRDLQRGLDYILPAKEARTVLAPVSLWLQEKVQKDEGEQAEVHKEMQPHLDETDKRPQAREFCENLIHRAGILAEYGEATKYYIFRHKSFREYLASQQMVEDFLDSEKMRWLVAELNENWDWWQEPLRFMMAEAKKADLFDLFMRIFFLSEVSEELTDKKSELLYSLIREAGRKKPDALIHCLNSPGMTVNQQLYILNCLKNFDSDERVLNAMAEFLERGIYKSAVVRSRAEEILAETGRMEAGVKETLMVPDLSRDLPKSLRNPLEYNAEYTLLPAGTLHYSVTNKDEPISPFYVAKYPVTNKQYRRFIRYLSGAEEELRLIDKLPVHVFGKQLLQYAQEIVGFSAYLGNDSGRWPAKLKAGTDEERNFDGDDQPGVAITWYAAHAYCFWLTLLTAKQQKRDLADLQMVYRLPHEKEWERAAAGTNEEGGPREYPWGKKTPDDKRANFNNNIGHTTPVGRYPDGATPHGLQDMAGNVWEWQGNWYDKEEKARVLRGGSFFVSANFLHCSNRHWYNPVNRRDSFGFRVVLAPLL